MLKTDGKDHTSLETWITGAGLLTLVWRCYCNGLCCELIIEVTCVCLWCDLGLKRWNKLQRRWRSVVLQQEDLVLNVTSSVLFSLVAHLFFNDILPVDGGEELVGHHFFGIVWSTSEPVNTTRTLSLSPTHHLLVLCKHNCALLLEMYNMHFCRSLLNCI